MSLDAQPVRLTKYGRVTIENGFVLVEDFKGKDCSCRDVAVLAVTHAIGVLQKELMAAIQKPGGGRIGVA